MKILNNLSQIGTSSFFETKTSIQKIAAILIDIKNKLMLHQKNSEEYSLKFYAKGFTTTPIPIIVEGNVVALEFNLDFVIHKLEILFGTEKQYIELNKPNFSSFVKEFDAILNTFSIPHNFDDKAFTDNVERTYNKNDSKFLWDLLRNIYFVFVKFHSPILKETSSINFWPHHFDVAMLLFSGKLISGQDKTNWGHSREQMNFGFLFGDEFIAKPYFYVTLYPFEKSLTNNKLNFGAYWYSEKWNGAILELDNLLQSANPGQTIIKFFEEIRNLAPEQFYKE
jgi:Family of unknown function (DUF5996)